VDTAKHLNFHSLKRRLREGEAFRERWLANGRDFVAVIGAVIATFFHSASLFTDRFVSAPAYVPVLTLIHEVVLGTLLAWVVLGHPMKVKLRHVFYLLTLFSVGAYAYVLHLCVADSAPLEDVTLASAAALALAVFCILLCPATSLVVALTAPVYLGMIWVAYGDHEAATRWLVIDALAIAAAASFHFGRGLLAQRQATAEYERLNSLGNKARGEQIKRRDAEQQLKIERAIALQAAKMASLAEMTAGIAHEINSPLSVIRVRAERLARAAGDLRPEELRDSAQRIVDTVDRISKIMSGMRVITRNGEADPFIQESLATIVTDVCELSQSRLRSQAIELRLVPIPEALMLECRSVEVAQVLVNLLNNACDASASSGASERWVRLAATETEDGVEIRVSDSGAGIPRRIRDRLFKPLTTTKPIGEGTGLGLSISKALIEAHGGRLTLDEGAHHTTFVVWLPKRQPQTGGRSADAA
jgi:C4-dicarboxylate-specific signal transduction histidine kinase